MSDIQFEPGVIVGILVRHEVRFVVIGGIAGRLHGSPRMTRDLDICYARTPPDLQRLAAALRELQVSLRGADKGLPFQVDARTLQNGLNFTFDTPYGSFDCLGDASNGYTYDVLAPNAELGDIGGFSVRVVSLDDLIRMKRATGRPQDLADVETLSKLREVREDRGLYGLAEPAEPAAPRTTEPRRSRTSARRRARARSH